MSEKIILGPGSKVNHPAYGPGVVVKVNVAAYSVCFIEHGMKMVGNDYQLWEIIEGIPSEETVTFSEAEKSIIKILKAWSDISEVCSGPRPRRRRPRRDRYVSPHLSESRSAGSALHGHDRSRLFPRHHHPRRTKAAQARAPIYVYQFYRSTPLEGGRYFTPHAAEIPFVFDTLGYAKSIGGEPTAQAQALSDMMSEAWCNFARDGDPNGGNVPNWPKYDGANRPTLVFDEKRAGGTRVENDPRSEQRKRMLSFGSQQYGEREAGLT